MESKHALNEEKIREKIREQDKTLREFAYGCGFSPERLSSILTGLHHGYAVTHQTAKRIADGLGVEIEDLTWRDIRQDSEGGEDHD